MLKSFTALTALLVLTTTTFAFTGTTVESSSSLLPLPPDTGIVVATSTPVAAPAPAVVVAPPADLPPSTPVRLFIPSINLSDAIVPIGLTSDGQMDVPSGTGSNVGWYKDGIVPGDIGSAVLDAHVFAAFSALKNVKIGNSIYVTDATGTKRRFVVQSSMVYKLGELTPDMLFTQTDGRRLNLITCAGQLTPDHSTYDHRLVVYAVLAD